MFSYIIENAQAKKIKVFGFVCLKILRKEKTFSSTYLFFSQKGEV